MATDFNDFLLSILLDYYLFCETVNTETITWTFNYPQPMVSFLRKQKQVPLYTKERPSDFWMTVSKSLVERAYGGKKHWLRVSRFSPWLPSHT